MSASYDPPHFYIKIWGFGMDRAGSCLHWELNLNKVYSCPGSLHITQGRPRKRQMRSFSFHWDKIRLGLMSQRSAIKALGTSFIMWLCPQTYPQSFSWDSQSSCQIYHSVPVLCFMWLSASLGFTSNFFALSWLSWHPSPNFPNNLFPWLQLITPLLE